MSLNHTSETESPHFRSDIHKAPWQKFVTEGTYYKLLRVDVAARKADMLVKFEPHARCLTHRHVAETTSLVLEGELHVHEKTPEGEVVTIKPAGTYSVGAENEVHVEGGGDEGVLVYFSMQGTSDVIYELIDPATHQVKRSISIQDFARDQEAPAQ